MASAIPAAVTAMAAAPAAPAVTMIVVAAITVVSVIMRMAGMMFLAVPRRKIRSGSCEEEAVGGIIPVSSVGAAFVIIIF
ncbi:hypothetical protein D3C73_1574740 [compost metagenome]